MNIRIRKHNDDVNLRVVELIVDDKVMDDIVCDSFTPEVIGAVTLMVNTYANSIDYEKGIVDHELREC